MVLTARTAQSASPSARNTTCCLRGTRETVVRTESGLRAVTNAFVSSRPIYIRTFFLVVLIGAIGLYILYLTGCFIETLTNFGKSFLGSNTRKKILIELDLQRDT